MRLILGSSSPRRRNLLAQIGVTPDEIRSPDIDETVRRGELPRAYCSRMALEKLDALEAAPNDIVLCADTTVALGRRILGKPQDVSEAEQFLRLLSGRRHRVITALAVKQGARIWRRNVQSAVRFKSLSDQEIKAYMGTNDWQGKAGGYGIQGPAGAFIPWINGSFPAIVGLPLVETAQLLVAAGYPLHRKVR
ncbi:MAG: nucleoside triphosphate pyrophosphatase [Pseudomonadota bacterium]